MKTIAEQVNLNGQLETISISDFRKQPGEVMASVALGKAFIIERNGKAVAALVPVQKAGFTVNVARDGKLSYSL